MSRRRWAILLYAAAAARAQPLDTLDLWLQHRIQTAVDKARIGINGKTVTRQWGSPGGIDRSASLVDHSSASDFVSTALNLAAANNYITPSGSRAGGTGGAGTVTATLYSLMAGLNHTSMTDPKFYAEHTAARQVSFTAGTAQSDPATDNSSDLATVWGIKVTPYNQRDLYSRTGQQAVKDVQAALTTEARAYLPLMTKVKNLIFYACQPDGICRSGKIDNFDTPTDAAAVQAFVAFWNKYQTNMRSLRLTSGNLDQIDALILSSLSAFSNYQKVVQISYDRIHRGAQLGLSYTAEVRDDPGYNHHRAEVIYDYGLSQSIVWTVNATGDYFDRKTLPSIHGGTVATEFLGRLTSESTDPDGRRPVMLAFSGLARWLSVNKPQYNVQSTLTVPLAPGVEAPIAFRWSNHALLLNHKYTELKLALNVDIGRVAAAFK